MDIPMISFEDIERADRRRSKALKLLQRSAREEYTRPEERDALRRLAVYLQTNYVPFLELD